MSLNTPVQVKQYRVGIVAAKNFDDASFLSELIGEKVESISHINTNGANSLVSDFAQENGISYTTFPLTGGRSLPWSAAQILDNSDFVYIIASPDSKSSKWFASECDKKKIRFKIVPYEPYSNWQHKVEAIADAFAEIKPEEIEANPQLKAVHNALLKD